jgi:hypothetical protein
MPLRQPKLDDRTFQDLDNEAKRLIPRYTPEWTDHNLSDPGVTLIELFAWMVDILLYRIIRVPEKNYIRFRDLLGIRLKVQLQHECRSHSGFQLLNLELWPCQKASRLRLSGQVTSQPLPLLQIPG